MVISHYHNFPTGALYVRNPTEDTPLHPMFFGGGQERNFRPGTENTGMIAGLGCASQLVVENLDQYHKNMKMVSNVVASVQWNCNNLTTTRHPNLVVFTG